MNTLTNEQKIQLFALYLGTDSVYGNSDPGSMTVSDLTLMLSSSHRHAELDRWKLHLVPVDRVSIPHKEELATYMAWTFLKVSKLLENRHAEIYTVITVHELSRFINRLRFLGYDCDEMIEKGLAIDKTLL